jgi:glycolate oxidase subunit GlcD
VYHLVKAAQEICSGEMSTTLSDTLAEDLREIVGDENVLTEPDELLVYECDGLPQHKHLPRAVVFPSSTEETAEVLSVLAEAGVSFAPRGAGTGLSGGALAVDRGVVIELARLRRILTIDPDNRLAVVQTGLVNSHLSRAAEPYGLYYVPDPSSQPACTIGGNIAENAGGIHCLKYGTTTDHIIAARIVLASGDIVDLSVNGPGYDLLGVFVGSEGTFGIATEATVRLSPIPPAVRTLLADFLNVDEASRAVSAIIAAGVLPAALEMMDNAIICAVEASIFAAGLPTDAQAVLLVELDGIEAGIDEEAAQVEAILSAHGARSVRRAADEKERKKLWAARKGAFGAVGRLLPDVMIQDAVVPRSRLPEVLAETYRISATYNLQLANVFHAGDGNLHPLICFDLRRGTDLEHVRQAGREIMEVCVRAGGSITGEHGVGLDKSSYLPLIFSDDDLRAMLQVRAAFDDSGLCNPGKIIPAPRGCGEARAVATHSLSETGVSEPEALATVSQTVSTYKAASSQEADKVRGKGILAERMNEARIKTELTRFVGREGVQRFADVGVDLASLANGNERVWEVAPANSKQTGQVIEFAARENLSLVPAGASTWLASGNRLSRADIVVSTRRMTHMIAHEPADLIATAEAGITLIDFQKQLAEAGQWLPVDPPDDGRATIGAVVATALPGPHSFGFGLLRSFVIGMRVTLADGRAIKAGGQVVKNVAGYDLCKLFTGSYGTLGLITEVTFKLRPLPAETRTICAVGPFDSLLKSGAAITQSFFPVAVELLSYRLARQLDVKLPLGAGALLIRFAGADRAVVSQTAQALKLLRDDTAIHCVTLDDDQSLWQSLSAAGIKFSADLSWRASLKPTGLRLFIEELRSFETDDSTLKSLAWHAGLGDGRVRAVARTPAYHREAVRALTRLREQAETSGGNLVLENAPVEIKNEFNSWGIQGPAGELMGKVKRQLDPQDLLSPGRFF